MKLRKNQERCVGCENGLKLDEQAFHRQEQGWIHSVCKIYKNPKCFCRSCTGNLKETYDCDE